LPDEPRVKVKKLDGLLVDFVTAEKAQVIVRGLRAVSDFEFEFQMALMNRRLAPAVETIFLMPKEDYSYISSRIVKEVARLGGDVSGVVTPPVAAALRGKFTIGASLP
jgi:pantetheine-phosphate adenylyltransferase